MQDVAVEVYFGKDHPVDSSEAAFKTAGRIAFKKAFLAAQPGAAGADRRPGSDLPSKYTGAILGDLNTKRARIENQDSLPGDLAVIQAKVPLAEVTRYAAQLGSITQGQGSYTMEFSHYDMVPGNVQQQIVSKAKLARTRKNRPVNARRIPPKFARRPQDSGGAGVSGPCPEDSPCRARKPAYALLPETAGAIVKETVPRLVGAIEAGAPVRAK